jgi:hypothetical protein
VGQFSKEKRRAGSNGLKPERWFRERAQAGPVFFGRTELEANDVPDLLAGAGNNPERVKIDPLYGTRGGFEPGLIVSL